MKKENIHILLAACFITDFGTVLALGVLFADFNITLMFCVLKVGKSTVNLY